MKIGIINKPSLELMQCELTFLDRESIHYDIAMNQHAQYADALQQAGVDVHVFDKNQTSPDSVFVEDVAIILDELAIICSMGTPSRRGEIDEMKKIISQFRDNIHQIRLPATIEGGDVLRVGRTLYVGQSSRTNIEGIDALIDIVSAFGYRVVPIRVYGCLHLKTGVTALSDDTLLINPNWIDVEHFNEYKLIEVAPDEPWAANVLRIDDYLITNAAFPETAKIIRSSGFDIHEIDISEFSKAEAGLTCMSLVFSA